MISMPACDRLSLDLMRRHLAAEIVGRHVYLLGTVDSTTAVLRRLAERGAVEGTVVFAEEQTAAADAAFRSSPDAITLELSVLFRPEIAPGDVRLFAAVGALALTDAIGAEGAAADVRWPSDVVIGERVVGAVTVDDATAGDRVQHVILGFRVNVDVAGAGADRNVFAARLLNLLEKWREIFVTRGRAAVLAAWQARDGLRGRRLQIRTGTAVWQGRGRGIDPSGCLIVEDSGGRPRRVTDGEVRILDIGSEEDV
ncbi:MAG TPA: biotin--[acetyl-CoA-carboxylase] ligase [Methylomirabilota bacterium]|nr:biotin--[acetyl-CoA-carboxylase] ligase [Methylomirabilota bacterium]